MKAWHYQFPDKRRMCVVDCHTYYGLKERVTELEADLATAHAEIERLRGMIAASNDLVKMIRAKHRSAGQ